MRASDDLVRQGKVLYTYTGISDVPAWWVAQANTLAQLRDWSPFVGLQIECSLIERTVERELIPMAKALNIGVAAWSPLACGVLTGKYHGRASSADGSEPGRLARAMMKDFIPEQQRADRIVRPVMAVSEATGRGHGAGRAGLAPLPRGTRDPYRRGPQALSIAGQSGQSGSGSLSGVIKSPGRGEPHRSRLSVRFI